MKKTLVIIAISLFSFIQMQAQNGVAISTSSSATPNASAILDVQSTTQGMLIPSMTQTQRDNISSPATGLMIFQTDNTAGFYYYDGSAWVSATGAKELNDLSDAKTSGYSSLAASVYIGQFAGASATSIYNTGVGPAALANVSGSIANTNGGNIAVGYHAGTGITTGGYNIVLGVNTEPSANTATHELNIGKTIYATDIYKASAKVGIGNGNNAPNSTLDVGGSVSLPYASGGDATLTDANYTYLVTSSGVTVTLPDATNIAGRVYIIKLTASGTATVGTTSSQQIDAATTYTLSAQYKYVQVQSTGSKWVIIGQN